MNFYIWRDNIIECLLGLSDENYQRLAWTGAVPSSDTSPDEMLVTLVDDWALASFVPDNRPLLTHGQVELVGALVAAIESYQFTQPGFDGDVDRVLASNEWQNVMRAAKGLQLALSP